MHGNTPRWSLQISGSGNAATSIAPDVQDVKRLIAAEQFGISRKKAALVKNTGGMTASAGAI